MAFKVYSRTVSTQVEILDYQDEEFSLAGYNLIYEAWNKEKPINKGWHVTADELIKIKSENKQSYSDRRLLIDFDPTADWRIGIIELLDIYIYTYGDEKTNNVIWSPMMLKFRDVIYDEDVKGLTIEQISKKKNHIEISDYSGEETIEFLYLNGSNRGWNWGMNGMTNAAFIFGEARKYFRQYF